MACETFCQCLCQHSHTWNKNYIVRKKKSRHGRDSNPRSLVYETNALPLGHRAIDFLVDLFSGI